MIYPARDTHSDPQCTSPSPPFPHAHPRTQTNLPTPSLGASLPSSTLAIVEMDIGIIAASLVLMRPFFHALFHALYNATCGVNLRRQGSAARPLVGRTLAREERAQGPGLRGNGGIWRTVDIELDSRSGSTSTEEVLGTRIWGAGGRGGRFGEEQLGWRN